VDDPEPRTSPNARDPAGVRRFLSRRLFWHTLGLVIALVLAWLILRAYRQPEFMIDLLSLRLC
jgi:FtsH-binding integral membrane protein